MLLAMRKIDEYAARAAGGDELVDEATCAKPRRSL